jgi:hypothetical protein
MATVGDVPPRTDVGDPQDAQLRVANQTRLNHLFRLWLRDGHIHPLIHLIQRYRSPKRK